MTAEKLKNILAVGETVAVEFKRCGNGISADTFETVCSFLNRFGGDIYLGVEDNGEVVGIPQNATPDIVKNFIKMVSNSEIINPTVYLTPAILEYEGREIVHIHIPSSSEVHTCKKVVYDRVGDADVKVTATGQIAQLFIRKQNIFTERKALKYVTDDDLRFDLLPKVRQIAINLEKDHPWKTMSDQKLLKSARLISRDADTGHVGYNLAAVMLLGRDEVINDVCPTYRTDALLRKVNTDRYDDRLIVETNLIESYEQLIGFAEKHLWDKFYLENDKRVSLRSKIIREMLVNMLIHREFSSNYIAKFVIERDRMYTENANRAETGNAITPENLEPNPKNPIIAAFFRNIGLADELGSGVRNLYRYVNLYSGKNPELLDGDIFRIIIPLDDNYSANTRVDKVQSAISKCNFCTLSEMAIIEYLMENPEATQGEIAVVIGKSLRSVKTNMLHLQEMGFLTREGSRRYGRWIISSKVI